MIFGKSVKFIKVCIFLYVKNGTSREGCTVFLQMDYSGSSMAKAWLV